ncbi:MAG: hypothetical protein CUN51_06550 [Candidatus Thermofonsia Clade 1 bacterium]|uniref:Uncharacterized protein n=1 Tax=Candidatus Thermofonsia Clade 1 bacterium TaxID=2364210 RepID=A0A2M8NZW1_9CHLR|nr:MAG: hypothetical protein CUN51_06550 [Candidatus Thermofonsia Clade 1 bacterium]
MPWTTPTTWVSAQVVTATQLNEQLRDNMNYLLSRPHQRIIRVASSNYTTTSTTFVDIDATNLSITLTISGSAVLVGFSGVAEVNSGPFYCFDFTVDGNRYTTVSNGLLEVHTATGFIHVPASYTALVMGLTVGSHTFRPVWRATSGTATLRAVNSPVVFWAMEVA